MNLAPIIEESLDDGRVFGVAQSQDGWPLYYIKDDVNKTWTIVCPEPIDKDGMPIQH